MDITEINQLGKKLELFSNIDYIGKGFPIILPNGAKIIKTIKDYVEDKEEEYGFKVVSTPCVSRAEIYKIADTLDVEKNFFFKIKPKNDTEKEENKLILKPYVHPFHCGIYKTSQHTYKELPIKYCETSTAFKNEKDVAGIMRAKQFTNSDATIFTTKDLLVRDLTRTLKMQQEILEKLDLDVSSEVRTWNEEKKEEYIGTIDEWKDTTNALKEAIENIKERYDVNDNAQQYGPSIYMYYNGRILARLQINFEIVHRFDLKYIKGDNTEDFPIYIHLTVLRKL